MRNTLPSAGAAAGSATTRTGIVTERVNPTTAALAEAAAGAPVLGVALSLLEQPANATTQEMSRNQPDGPQGSAGGLASGDRTGGKTAGATVLMDRPAGSTARDNIPPSSTPPSGRSESRGPPHRWPRRQSGRHPAGSRRTRRRATPVC